jgi:hypothetical protein
MMAAWFVVQQPTSDFQRFKRWKKSTASRGSYRRFNGDRTRDEALTKIRSAMEKAGITFLPESARGRAAGETRGLTRASSESDMAPCVRRAGRADTFGAFVRLTPSRATAREV